ncbi:diacylglycerol kinase 1 [Prunus yedoensis var. nudiflora]|uniref:Diacylglycerol kinase 1 n=1 Tax=Prunus yedoensis var. nudiflora TaxID=2094558 RepID=A0A314YRR8_PRUYE|nr:diacylglycerol kinase 1 [Prunus yedoensis var. nudiflora]
MLFFALVRNFPVRFSQIIPDKLNLVFLIATGHLDMLGGVVGLSRARRLAQGQSIKIHLFAALPVQACMLKRAAEETLGHAAAIITDVLENAETNHVISAMQKRALLQEMALRLLRLVIKVLIASSFSFFQKY